MCFAIYAGAVTLASLVFFIIFIVGLIRAINDGSYNPRWMPYIGHIIVVAATGIIAAVLFLASIKAMKARRAMEESLPQQHPQQDQKDGRCLCDRPCYLAKCLQFLLPFFCAGSLIGYTFLYIPLQGGSGFFFASFSFWLVFSIVGFFPFCCGGCILDSPSQYSNN